MGLTNSRTGATRATLEEKRRRDRETALEDGVPAILFLLYLGSDLRHIAEYARAQRREEEDLDVDREWSRRVLLPLYAHLSPYTRS